MSILLKIPKQTKARKIKTCDQCRSQINVNDQYMKYDSNNIWFSLHPQCYQMAIKQAVLILELELN